jgi:hypothetical protein
VRQHPGPGTESLSLGASSIVAQPQQPGRATARIRPGRPPGASTAEEAVMSPTRPAHRDRPVGPVAALAALARAQLHRAAPEAAVPLWAILAQLDLPRRSRGARETAEVLARLRSTGAVLAERRHGVQVWSITPAGRALLDKASPDIARLPESPQHRAWRNARTLAREEIGRLRSALRESLREAEEMLRAGRPQRSEDWFALAERLQRRAWTLGSATYCLCEWDEPDDRSADLDPGGGGRRNVSLWRP